MQMIALKKPVTGTILGLILIIRAGSKYAEASLGTS